MTVVGASRKTDPFVESIRTESQDQVRENVCAPLMTTNGRGPARKVHESFLAIGRIGWMADAFAFRNEEQGHLSQVFGVGASLKACQNQCFSLITAESE